MRKQIFDKFYWLTEAFFVGRSSASCLLHALKIPNVFLFISRHLSDGKCGKLQHRCTQLTTSRTLV